MSHTDVRIVQTTDGTWWLWIATADQCLYASPHATLVSAINEAQCLRLNVDNAAELPLQPWFRAEGAGPSLYEETLTYD